MFFGCTCLCCHVKAFSTCTATLCCRGAQASHCSGFSCCRAQTLGHVGFSSCGSWALELLCMGFSCSGARGILRTRDKTRVPCIGRWTLIHSTTREAPRSSFLMGVEKNSPARSTDIPSAEAVFIFAAKISKEQEAATEGC